jgi:hypothetical protein
VTSESALCPLPPGGGHEAGTQAGPVCANRRHQRSTERLGPRFLNGLFMSNSGWRSRATALRSGRQQLAAAEVVDGKHDALEMAPPDRGRDADVGLHHWRNQLEQHGQAVIMVERRAVVAFDA